MPHTNLMALSFIEPELWAFKVYIAGLGILDFSAPVTDLDLDSMTFIYALNLYPLETYRMCENERPMSRLSKSIVLRAANECIYGSMWSLSVT